MKIISVRLLIYFIFFSSENLFAQSVIFAFNTNWKYLDDGSNQHATWQQINFDDNLWKNGNSDFGFGNNAATQLEAGHATYYFRKTILISNPQSFANFSFNCHRDDGLALYVNGVEVYRNNLPASLITYQRPASQVCLDNGDSIITTTIPDSFFVNGDNVIAAEVHNFATDNSDLLFSCKLTGNLTNTLPVITRGAYMNMVTDNSIVIEWRTKNLSDSEVRFGKSADKLFAYHINPKLTKEHTITLNGLTPDTKYFYSIGSIGCVLQSGELNYFITAPPEDTASNLRFWITGDYGKTSAVQTEVRNSFIQYNSGLPVNGWLLLGDNAYEYGTDDEYQTQVFEFNSELLKNIPLFPAVGNHDYGNVGYLSDLSFTSDFPYYNIFKLPVESGTEKYYSFNYGNAHFISLDSYGAYNFQGSEMYNWLQSDLMTNTKRWTIVYFHHPPYTKGSHDSDTEIELINMRQNIVPLLEAFGVDLVMSGHSHVYEHSALIKGHTGLESSFDTTAYPEGNMVQHGAGPYFKNSDNPDGTVYVVCGAGSKTTTLTAEGYPHNAMVSSIINIGGSGLLEIKFDTLSFKFIAQVGTVPDSFRIIKSGSNHFHPPNQNTTFAVYPNPASGNVWLSYQTNSVSGVQIKISVTDVLGKEIYDASPVIYAGSYSPIFIPQDAFNAQSGIYFVRVMRFGEQIFADKIFVE